MGRGGRLALAGWPSTISLSRVVAAVGDTATQTDANLEEDDVDASATAVVAMVAETCLVEAVEAEKVEDPDAKAKAARC